MAVGTKGDHELDVTEAPDNYYVCTAIRPASFWISSSSSSTAMRQGPSRRRSRARTSCRSRPATSPEIAHLGGNADGSSVGGCFSCTGGGLNWGPQRLDYEKSPDYIGLLGCNSGSLLPQYTCSSAVHRFANARDRSQTKRQRRGRRAQPGIARDLGDRQLGPTTAQPLGRPSGNVAAVGIDAAVAIG